MVSVKDTCCLCAPFSLGWCLGHLLPGVRPAERTQTMEITINGNVTINNNETNNTQAQQEERKPLDRTNEVLISNETSFSDLIRILSDRPEALAASRIEAEEKEREAEEERKRKAYGDDYDLLAGERTLEKADRRPGAVQLRLYEPMIARLEMSSGGCCEVFSNGYAVYDNGNRKTVIWVPDCGSVTYYFGPLKEKEKEYLKQKDEIGEDILGPAPWYNALIIAGEDSIERNLIHPKSVGTVGGASENEDSDTVPDYIWRGSSHIETPEEYVMRMERKREALELLTEDQKEAIILHFVEGYKQKDIAKMLGIDPTSVRDRIKCAKVKLGRNFEKIFS